MTSFKNGQEQAMIAISATATNAAQNAAYSLTSQPLNQALAWIIASAIRTGFEEYHRQQYSEEDFEKDIELKS